MTSVGFAERLRALLSTANAAADLERFFRCARRRRHACLYGSRFEHLGGGGDRADIANVVTAADLIAVQAHSVQAPPSAALALLEGHLAGELRHDARLTLWASVRRTASRGRGFDLAFSETLSGRHLSDDPPCRVRRDP
ncbi:DUF6308 family protein [[Kitasatospora] papulosa]|uniref:DUF6308 family protein n=1 Tax=Streptomyces sp. NPDC004623 TaxID=3156653 RepID=UPI0033B71B18